MDDTTLARFMAKVDRTGTCWLWTAQRTKGSTGYGKFRIHGRYYSAHRIAYEHFTGPIPSGHFVCHRCDVAHCVNPEHLFTGTPAENSADAAVKGRMARGDRNPMTMLTPDAVRAIRADGRTQTVIAAEYGVTQYTISDIKRRATWAWLE